MNAMDPEKTVFHEDQQLLNISADVEPTTVLFRGSPYIYQQRLGKGGFAEVYLAVDSRTGQQVALKILLPRLSENPEIDERFRHAAKHMKSLKHPGIIEVYDYIVLGERPTIVLEYVSGITLEQKLKQSGPLSVDKAIDIAIQLCDALIYAHDSGIIHRDVNPSNIHVTSESVVKLGDFDIAKFSADPQVTRVGSRLGTPYYMSPEQIRGERDVDARSDVFSLATVLYEMVTGEIPVGSGKQPSHVNLAVPKSLNDTILKGLDRSREARHRSMRELRDALVDSRRQQKRIVSRTRRQLVFLENRTKRFLRSARPWLRPSLQLNPGLGVQPICLVADFCDNVYVGYKSPGSQGYVYAYSETGESRCVWHDSLVPVAMTVGWDSQRRRPTSLFVVAQSEAENLTQLLRFESPALTPHLLWEDKETSERLVSVAVTADNDLLGLFQAYGPRAEIRRMGAARWVLLHTLELESVVDMAISGCWFFVLHDAGVHSFEVDPLIAGFQQRSCQLPYAQCASVDSEGCVYVSDRRNRLFAFDVETGQNRWYKEFESFRRFGVGSKRIWMLELRSDGWRLRDHSLRRLWVRAQAGLLPQWKCEEGTDSGAEP